MWRHRGSIQGAIPSDPRDSVAPTREPLTQLGVDRIVSAARASLAHGGLHVRLRLHPESLGEVRVEVRWEGGVLSARLEAATPAARESLESGAQGLRTALQEHGIPVERLSVGIRMDLQTRSHDRSLASEAERFGEAVPGTPSAIESQWSPEPAASGRLDIRI